MKKLLDLLMEKGISQKELAVETGLYERLIGKYVNNDAYFRKTYIEYLYRIASFLDVDVEEFYDYPLYKKNVITKYEALKKEKEKHIPKYRALYQRFFVWKRKGNYAITDKEFLEMKNILLEYTEHDYSISAENYKVILERIFPYSPAAHKYETNPFLKEVSKFLFINDMTKKELANILECDYSYLKSCFNLRAKINNMPGCLYIKICILLGKTVNEMINI